jgi:hypothetical protein
MSSRILPIEFMSIMLHTAIHACPLEASLRELLRRHGSPLQSSPRLQLRKEALQLQRNHARLVTLALPLLDTPSLSFSLPLSLLLLS